MKTDFPELKGLSWGYYPTTPKCDKFIIVVYITGKEINFPIPEQVEGFIVVVVVSDVNVKEMCPMNYIGYSISYSQKVISECLSVRTVGNNNLGLPSEDVSEFLDLEFDKISCELKVVAKEFIKAGTTLYYGYPLSVYSSKNPQRPDMIEWAIQILSSIFGVSSLLFGFMYPRTKAQLDKDSSPEIQDYSTESQLNERDDRLLKSLVPKIKRNCFFSGSLYFLYFYAGFFNHSCDSNAIHTQNPENNMISISSRKDIQKGEEVTISYTGYQQEPRDKSILNFKCACHLCVNNNSIITKNCIKCGRSDQLLKKCGKCKKSLYCSKWCQTEDWKSHKPNCAEFVATI